MSCLLCVRKSRLKRNLLRLDAKRFAFVPLFFGRFARFLVEGLCLLDIGVLVFLEPCPVVAQRFDNVLRRSINDLLVVAAPHDSLDFPPVCANPEVGLEQGLVHSSSEHNLLLRRCRFVAHLV